MSTFSVKVRKIEILPHPNADTLELAKVDDYQCVVKKDQYKTGDLIIYIPEAAIVPEWILKQFNFWNEKENKGILSGSKGNKVKAINLRGSLSQGIVIPCPWPDDDIKKENFFLEGCEVGELLGIVKWEPPIPIHMAGEVFNAGSHLTVNYDIENFKAFPNVLQEGEEVIMSEKIHGSFCGITIVPEIDGTIDMFDGRILVYSKGLGSQGLCFRNTPKNDNNVYIRVLKQTRIFEQLLHLFNDITVPVFILGEVYGPNVQNGFSYGKDLSFSVFDMGAGYRGKQLYWDYERVCIQANLMGLKTVPLIYRGPFSKEKMIEVTSGKETISGETIHMREGVVVKPASERRDEKLGRVILKSVSEEYLTRKGGTEYN